MGGGLAGQPIGAPAPLPLVGLRFCFAGFPRMGLPSEKKWANFSITEAFSAADLPQAADADVQLSTVSRPRSARTGPLIAQGDEEDRHFLEPREAVSRRSHG